MSKKLSDGEKKLWMYYLWASVIECGKVPIKYTPITKEEYKLGKAFGELVEAKKDGTKV